MNVVVYSEAVFVMVPLLTSLILVCWGTNLSRSGMPLQGITFRVASGILIAIYLTAWIGSVWVPIVSKYFGVPSGLGWVYFVSAVLLGDFNKRGKPVVVGLR